MNQKEINALVERIAELRAENERLQNRIMRMQRSMSICMYNRRMTMWTAFLLDNPDAVDWVKDDLAALRGEE